MPNPFSVALADLDAPDVAPAPAQTGGAFAHVLADLDAPEPEPQYKPVLVGAGEEFQKTSRKLGQAIIAGPALVEAAVRRFVGPAPSASDPTPLGNYLEMQRRNQASDAAVASYDQRPGIAGLAQETLDATAGSVPAMIPTLGVGALAPVSRLATPAAQALARAIEAAKAGGISTFTQEGQDNPTPRGLTNAAAQGILEGVFTKIGGASGVEALLKQGGPEALQQTVLATLHKLAAETGKEMSEEGATGLSQELARQLIIEGTIDPEKAARAGLVSAGAGAAMGGAANVPGAISDLPVRQALDFNQKRLAELIQTAGAPRLTIEPRQGESEAGQDAAARAAMSPEAAPVQASAAGSVDIQRALELRQQQRPGVDPELIRAQQGADLATKGSAERLLADQRVATIAKSQRDQEDAARATAKAEADARLEVARAKAVADQAAEQDRATQEARMASLPDQAKAEVVANEAKAADDAAAFEQDRLANDYAERLAILDESRTTLQKQLDEVDGRLGEATSSPTLTIEQKKARRAQHEAELQSGAGSRMGTGEQESMVIDSQGIARPYDQSLAASKDYRQELARRTRADIYGDLAQRNSRNGSIEAMKQKRDRLKADLAQVEAQHAELTAAEERGKKIAQQREAARVKAEQAAAKRGQAEPVTRPVDQIDTPSIPTRLPPREQPAKIPDPEGVKRGPIPLTAQDLAALPHTDRLAYLRSAPIGERPTLGDIRRAIQEGAQGKPDLVSRAKLRFEDWKAVNSSNEPTVKESLPVAKSVASNEKPVRTPQIASPRADRTQPATTRLTADHFRRTIAELPISKRTPGLADSLNALVDARARAVGKTTDQWIHDRISGVKTTMGEPSLNQDVLDQSVHPKGESGISIRGNRLMVEGKDVGLAEVHDQTRESSGGNGVEIGRLYIDKAHQKQGIGRRVIQHLFDEHPQADFIDVYPSGSSESFWLRMGGRPVGKDGYLRIKRPSDTLHQGDTLNDSRVVRRGAVEFANDGRAIIHAFEHADASTVLHELGHVFRRDLSDAEQAIAGKWAGAKTVDGVLKWDRAAEEKFARGFERYMRDGQTPIASLKPIFDKFANWLREVYKTVTGSAISVRITPDIRGVFDRLFAEGQKSAPVKESVDVSQPPDAKSAVRGGMSEARSPLRGDQAQGDAVLPSSRGIVKPTSGESDVRSGGSGRGGRSASTSTEPPVEKSSPEASGVRQEQSIRGSEVHPASRQAVEAEKRGEVPTQPTSPSVAEKAKSDAAETVKKAEENFKPASSEAEAKALTDQQGTGNHNELSAETRKEFGLPDRSTPEGRTFDEMYDAGKEEAASDPHAIPRLIEELRRDPERIVSSKTEAGMLLKHKVDLEREMDSLRKQAKEARDSGDLNGQLIAQVGMVKQRAAIVDFAQLMERSGTAAGRALVARKMMSNMDYSLSHMETEAAVAKGSPLTDAELAKVDTLYQDIKKANEDAQKRLNRTIGRYEDLIADQNFEKPPKPPAAPRDAETIRLQTELEAARRKWRAMVKNYERAKRTTGQKVGDFLKDLPGQSKSLKASLDNSAIFRQGWRVMFTNPVIWQRNARRSFVDMWKTFGGKYVMDEIEAEVKANPYYEDALRAKLAISGHEDDFPVSLPAKIPVLGRAFRASEFAMTGFQFRNRIQIFEKMMEVAKRSGVDTTDTQQLRSIGKLVNSLTSRGSLGRAEPVGDIVNNVFFSARKMKADFDFLTVHSADTSMSRFARKQALFNLVKVASGMAVIMMIAQAAKPDSVEEDPRSANFGKIKVGNTRFDISGGVSPILTLAARLFTGSTKASTSGKVRELNDGKFGSQTKADVIANFFGNKLSPAASVILDHLRGHTFDGKPPSIGHDAWNLLVPMAVANFIELQQDAGATPEMITAGVLADFVGIGTNTYSGTPAPKR